MIFGLCFNRAFNHLCPPPQLHSWQLVIVGDGDIKSEIETKIKDLGLQDSIILKPFTKDIESEYLNASIYAMSSYYEGFPMVLLESCSYGLCPISFDIKTGPSDIIENNKSGYLIQDNDLHTYAHKLIELMSDENKRKTMGEAAKARVAQKFSKEAIMPLWEEVLGGK
ncbi:glycosyltransferase [Helicobacter typhlonius]|uniref:glycosyltransferase n=2 Tax=Helicobacter typhlonius TaxID=76936 RepID=UPI002A4E2BA7|nr:glycosyltransferase [Helicobacter typhlonius]